VPGHAFAMVDAIGNGGAAESFVVQTTCRDWFAAAGDAELQRNLLRRTIGASAADTAAQAKRERRLTDVGLLAVMYYNRGVDLLEVGNHEAAIAANRTALQLDQANDAARANLLAGLNNWSLELGRRGDFAQALRTLETGLQFAPEYGLFHENLVALHQQRLAGSTSPRDAEPSLTALRGCYARWHRELSRRGLPVEADAVARRAADDPFLRGVN
jgi:tetratricopeptide (TPR) repeat protein